MKVIYIAGAICGTDDWRREQNIRRAEEVAVRLIRGGAIVICPHSLSRFAEDLLPHDEWILRDLHILRRCDALVLVEGWEKSTGACSEKEYAEKLGIPVFEAENLYDGECFTFVRQEETVGCLSCGTDISSRKNWLLEALEKRRN